MGDYLLEKNSVNSELDRLKLIERYADSQTKRLILNTGITDNWKCLELGTGGGSIFKWLGEKVGKDGKVVGIDRNTAYIEKYNYSPYSVIKEDFLNLSFDSLFNLIHCRYVLIHNKDAFALLDKMYSLIEPGGFFVLEEPDFTSSVLFAPANDQVQVKVGEASCEVFKQKGLDPASGLSLPEKLNSMGLDVIEVDSKLHLCQGNSPEALMSSESVNVLREEFVSTGLVNNDDIDLYIKNAKDKNHWGCYFSTISVVAKK